LFWTLWHAPVVNNLGTATPDAAYWLPFLLAFSSAMTAVRVLISWIYANTQSVLLEQLLHASSTGSLVIFGSTHATAAQEATWYAVYGAVLWAVVAIVVMKFGRLLGRRESLPESRVDNRWFHNDRPSTGIPTASFM
jgi:CAAX protease family protein